MIIPRHRQLPIELSDYIIDHLWNDPAALEACTLTCRAWFGRARFHTFRHITLVNMPDFQQLEKMIKKAPARFVPYVRSLLITKSDSGRPSRMDREWPKLLLTLVRVEKVVVDHWFAEALSAEVVQIFPSCFVALKSLHIKHVWKWRPNEIDLLRVVSACPKLTTLRLDNIPWNAAHLGSMVVGDVGMPLPPAITANIPAGTIRLDKWEFADCQPTVSTWLALVPFKLRPRKLEFNSYTPFNRSAPRALRDLLYLAGDALEELTIGFSSLPVKVPAPTLDQLCLEHNPKLATINIVSFYVRGKSRYYTGQVKRVNFVLRILYFNHRAFEKITISLSASDCNAGEYDTESIHDACHEHWEAFDRALARVAEESPGIVFVLNICGWGVPLAEWAEGMAHEIAARLRWLQGMECRLGVVCGEEWNRDAAASGGFEGERREHWFECPSLGPHDSEMMEAWSDED